MLQGLGLFFIPLLCGYWFLTLCNFTKFRILRDSGYHLLFRSAIVGFVLFISSHILVKIVEYPIPDNQIFLAWQNWVPMEILIALICTVFFSLILPILFNLFYDKIEAAREVAEQNGDFIELLIDQSINQSLPVELSLRSGKSYVGYAIKSRLATQSEVDLVLVPIVSGYRKTETRELEITTHYSSIIEEFDKNIEDFRIVIPMSEIVSARLFDREVYARFQDIKLSENIASQ